MSVHYKFCAPYVNTLFKLCALCIIWPQIANGTCINLNASVNLSTGAKVERHAQALHRIQRNERVGVHVNTKDGGKKEGKSL